jgi:hypothetical protein
MKHCTFLFVVFLSVYALAQEAPATLRGSWTATVGPTQSQVYRGTWTAAVASRTPNSARGTWTLYVDADQSVVQGTWTAQKAPAAWHGSWTAKTVQGRAFSGTWTSDDEGLSGKTLLDLLQKAVQQQIAGSWRAGALTGNWWLRGPGTSTPK